MTMRWLQPPTLSYLTFLCNTIRDGVPSLVSSCKVTESALVTTLNQHYTLPAVDSNYMEGGLGVEW